MKALFYFIFLISLGGQAQIKGIVVDENKHPISYVNISVESENNATTSEENGTFSIAVAPDKNLVFSALGYENKTVKASDAGEVVLHAKTFELDEVVISNSIGTKQLLIGQTENTIAQAFDNGPRMDLKFFPYAAAYKRIKFIKKVTIVTDSRIENATMRLHFYSVDDDGMPGESLLKKSFLVSIKKGTKTNRIDVSDFNLIMPKKGIFVGFEKLFIESNTVETTITDYNTNTTKTQRVFYPYVLYNYVENDYTYTFSGGKWNRKKAENTNTTSGKPKAYVPAIYLTLTN